MPDDEAQGPVILSRRQAAILDMLITRLIPDAPPDEVDVLALQFDWMLTAYPSIEHIFDYLRAVLPEHDPQVLTDVATQMLALGEGGAARGPDAT